MSDIGARLSVPARLQQETLRANGCCGEASCDGKWLCVKPRGHDGNHGDRRWPESPSTDAAMEAESQAGDRGDD